MKFEKKRYLPVLLILLLFAAGSRIGAVSAKYVTERTLQSQVTFTAKLAEKMVLEEHEAVRQSGGDYKLNTSEFTKANDYVMMPGVDIVKDPYIRITDKTDIEAYLFIEIVGHKPGSEKNGVSYTLKKEWKPVDGLPGRHGGAVYVYSDTNGTVKIKKGTLPETDGLAWVHIISGGKVYVSQKLAKDANLEIKFYAVMAEAVEGKSLAQTYNDAVTLPQNTP